MDPFQSLGQFNPQIYESSNVPPSSDKLFSFSGFQAGLMTNQASSTQAPNANLQQQQPRPPSIPSQQHFIRPPQQQQPFVPPQQAPSALHPAPSQSQHPMIQPSGTTSMSHFQPSASPPAIPSAPIASSTSNQGDSGRYSGMYANTGFDMLSILSRVANRPNPQINLGPVDLSCSFVVVDAKQYDFPLVYASPMFERLTGYAPSEVIGRNCRFLQAPDGRVAIGSRRKYTDNTTVYHIKTHMVQGKESQSSIINYRKTGQPFVNLLTVIPIAWESSEDIDYFIGLQVDLVEQPNSIFQSMKDGTYTVSYRNSTIPPSIQAGLSINADPSNAMAEPITEWTRPVSPKPMYNANISQQPHHASLVLSNKNVPITESTTLPSQQQQQKQHQPSQSQQHHAGQPSEAEPPMDVETLIKEASTDEGKFRRCWHELLLDQSPDFIHVLTIKGIFLYCSDSTAQLLEYEPSELVGKSLKAICHPSDITTVMRELKQSSNHSTEPVNLIYRVRRKNSGYMWIECCGKLRNEDGRGRKYVVLSGRERPVYQLPRSALTVGNKAHCTRTSSTMPDREDHEFWGKLSADGLLLYVSWTVANVLGSPPSEIIGTSLYQLLRSNRTTDLTRALAEVKEGKIVYLKHALLDNTGVEVMVATTFYPDGKASLQEQPSFVLMQTKVLDEETTLADEEPVFVSMDPDVKKKGRADMSLPNVDSNGVVTPAPQNISTAERVVEELDIGRDTNWQYELHQLRISNKKMRDDLSILIQRAKEAGNKEDTIVCSACFRRFDGSMIDTQEYSPDEPLLCNACSLREIQQSSNNTSNVQ
ncbi:white collar 1 protein [Mucor ambiguus]|uniref:White collar 1 protein n=1 Tax=Mucor ambiguus TaxID=91626 RepID=A0A0C9M6P5_9FUNG|nr:white collar 1 protein [Mucor ambiguus]